MIDVLAKSLKEKKLDYGHGTGHGVGFLNVHEGPQAITKLNEVKICEGMFWHEPGFYKKVHLGQD